MFKKLLFLLVLSIPLLAQTHSWKMQWTNMGVPYVNKLQSGPPVYVTDSIYIINAFDGSTFRWDGNTTWADKAQLLGTSELGEDPGGSTFRFGRPSVFSRGDSLFLVYTMSGEVWPPGSQTLSRTLCILNTSNSEVITADAGTWDGLETSLPDNQLNFSPNDSLILYGNRLSYNNTTKMVKTRWDGGVIIDKTNTNLNIQPRAGNNTWSKNPYKQFYLGDTLYILEGIISGRTIKTDTITVFKSTDVNHLLWSSVTSMDGTDNIYVLPKDLYVYQDTAYFFNTCVDTTESSLYGIWKFDGSNFTPITIPTNLNPYSFFMNDKGEMFVSVCRYETPDSNKVYMRSTHGNWSWTSNAPFLPNAFMSHNDTLYMARQVITSRDVPVTGQTTGVSDNIYFLSGFITLNSPNTGDDYQSGDPVSISWSGTDTAMVYYSTDAGGTWTFLVKDDISPYNWYHVGIHSNTAQIRVTNTDSSFMDQSGNFSVDYRTLNILSPTDSTGTILVGGTINIFIKIAGIDTISLWYSIVDSSHWVPILLNDSVGIGSLDTLIYPWIVPNVYGTIYIKVSEAADTNHYNIQSNLTFLGNTKRPNPAICWDPQYINPIEMGWIVDLSCGWASPPWELVTTLIKDQGDGYNFTSEYCGPPYDTCQVPRALGTWLATITDTTYTYLTNFYSKDDSLNYKSRTYYILNDTLFCDDNRNSIDRVPIVDLQDYIDVIQGGYHTGWTNAPDSLYLYNVQRSKIQGDTLSATMNFETLNDANFSPKILLIAPAFGGGYYVYSVNALATPATLNPLYDVQRIFTNLNIRRTKFRGIDPKAHKVVL